MWWKCALMIQGALEAVWSLQRLLRWKVFLCRRGSAATDPDLHNRLVSALFVAPRGATSCWRSHRDAISTLNNTEFYLWSKTTKMWKIVFTAFQSGPHWHSHWLHPLFEVAQLDSRAAERDTVRGSNPQQNFNGRTDTAKQTSVAPELNWFLFFHCSKLKKKSGIKE